MNDLHMWLTIAVAAAVTIILRFLPFAVWSERQKPPEIIEKLGRLLPYAIMGMLVVYCLKDTGFSDESEFAPELIACGVVAITYIWKRNTLFSIVCGTVCCMLLLQLVF